ncbi:MAG: response regulator transcription factor [Gemmatimonadetes bacterium]|nr:response regulator transcription factor [Gemmatimonadota bacterium]
MNRDVIQVLIVDDEPLARTNLRHALAVHPQLRVVAECAGVSEARAFLHPTPRHATPGTDRSAEPPEAPVDVVFLDIRMPSESGLVLARELVARAEPPIIVFVTAHGDFAIEAFEIHALDYLLKPVEDARLAQAVARIAEMLHLRQRAAYATAVRDYLTDASEPPAGHPTPYLSRLSVRSVGRIESIAVDDVRWFGASGNYVELHLAKRVVLHRLTIGALERRLDPAVFLRVHRSAIVRRADVGVLRVTGDGTYVLQLRSGAQVPVSERYVDAVRATMGE